MYLSWLGELLARSREKWGYCSLNAASGGWAMACAKALRWKTLLHCTDCDLS